MPDIPMPEAPFEAPWQAQLFALTVALNEAGHLPWSDWVAEFGPRVQGVAAGEYWQAWAGALVALLQARGIAGADEVAALAERWQAAAQATPHGQPITLDAADRVSDG
ncbi:MAG: nitrile hydratase accessory protein [Paracoccaceae bacterium]